MQATRKCIHQPHNSPSTEKAKTISMGYLKNEVQKIKVYFLLTQRLHQTLEKGS